MEKIGKGEKTDKTRKTVKTVARDVPSKKELGSIDVSTGMYTGDDVDALLASNKLIEDEDIPGDFYTIAIKSGRLIVRKVLSSNG